MSSLQFILGCAGTGKSQQIIDRISETLMRAPDAAIILLVPEQASYNYEFQLATDPDIGGLLSVQVLSFERLAWTVLQQVGGGAKMLVSDIGKLMILRQEILAASDQICFLKGAAAKPGQLQAIAEMISEFKRYGYTPESLSRVLSDGLSQDNVLGLKLKDLQMIYQGYAAKLNQQGMDSDDALDMLIQKIPQWLFAQGADIYIDGFDGFTPQELKVVKLLMQYTQSLTVALTVPVGADRKRFILQQVFAQPLQTVATLSEAAVEADIEILEDIVLIKNHRQCGCADLHYLEQQYFNLQVEPFSGEADNIQIIEAQNITAEVEYIASEIRRLCREEGYHYHDIAVFLRDLSDYEAVLQNVFADYDIPYFLDQRYKVLYHPLLEVILAAIAIAQDKWSYQSLFRYMKSDLIQISREESDMLENYVLAFGIKGYHWQMEQPWTYQKRYTIEDGQADSWSPEDLARINGTRFKVAGPLQSFHQQLAEAKNCAEIICCIMSLLETLQIPEQLQAWSEQAIGRGDTGQWEIHKQIWNKVMEIFDQLVLISGADTIELKAFTALLETGFQNIDLGMIPTNLDQVQIGVLQRSRSHELKAVFLLGINEGIFPAMVHRTGLLSDTERKALEQWGIQLSPNDVEQLIGEEYLVYVALSRASKHLYLSYALCDLEGKGRKPSQLIRRIRELLPTAISRFIQWPPDKEADNMMEYLEHPLKALGLLGEALCPFIESENSEIWMAVYDWLLNSSSYHNRLKSLLQGLFYQNQPEKLSSQLTEKLYPTVFQLSVSSIEKYQQCPYAHFLTYGLRLKERMTYELESFDIGQFYHKAMELLEIYLRAHHLSWHLLEDQEIKRIVSEIVEELAPLLQNEILLSSGRYQYIKRKLGLTLEQSVKLMAFHGRRGDFDPVSVETAFGGNNGLPGMVLQLNEHVSVELVGRIDRIECAVADSTCYLRIIDFKTGTKGLSLTEIYYGLKIQLLVYLNIVMQYYQQLGEAMIFRPAGVFYYFFKNPIIKSDTPLEADEIQLQLMKEMIPSGLVLADLAGLRLADKQLSIGKSLLLPVTLKKGADAYLSGEKDERNIKDILELFDRRSSSVVTAEQMALLEQYVTVLMVKAGQQMVEGNIAISPCRIKDFDSCQYCTFGSICHINLAKDNNLRELVMLERESIWQSMEEAVSNGETMDSTAIGGY